MAKKIFSQEPETYILALAESLKKIPEFEVPEWANFVKSGASRERPPTQVDFWYIRAASILRQLYIKGVVGVGRLRTRYGTRKDRGTMPDEFRKAGGKIIRVILQQAEKAGLVEKISRLQHGRRLTDKGRDLLDSIEVIKKESIDLHEVLVHKNNANIDSENEIENDDERNDGMNDEVDDERDERNDGMNDEVDDERDERDDGMNDEVDDERDERDDGMDDEMDDESGEEEKLEEKNQDNDNQEVEKKKDKGSVNKEKKGKLEEEEDGK